MRKQSLRSKLLDMLFPPRCIFCNEIVPIGSCICKKCDDKIFLLDDIQTAKVENESDVYKRQVILSTVSSIAFVKRTHI